MALDRTTFQNLAQRLVNVTANDIPVTGTYQDQGVTDVDPASVQSAVDVEVTGVKAVKKHTSGIAPKEIFARDVDDVWGVPALNLPGVTVRAGARWVVNGEVHYVHGVKIDPADAYWIFGTKGQRI